MFEVWPNVQPKLKAPHVPEVTHAGLCFLHLWAQLSVLTPYPKDLADKAQLVTILAA